MVDRYSRMLRWKQSKVEEVGSTGASSPGPDAEDLPQHARSVHSHNQTIWRYIMPRNQEMVREWSKARFTKRDGPLAMQQEGPTAATQLA